MTITQNGTRQNEQWYTTLNRVSGVARRGKRGGCPPNRVQGHLGENVKFIEIYGGRGYTHVAWSSQLI